MMEDISTTNILLLIIIIAMIMRRWHSDRVDSIMEKKQDEVIELLGTIKENTTSYTNN